MAIGDTTEETTEAIRDYMEGEDGAEEWSHTRNSRFENSKLIFMHAIPPGTTTDDLGPTLNLRSGTVPPSAEAKFLGVWIDRKLRFQRQAEHAIRKGTAWLMQFGRLARPKKGITMRHV